MTLGLLAICAVPTIVVGAVLSYVFSLISYSLAIQYKALDIPRGARKIHDKPIPLWGGTGIAITLAILVLAMASSGLLVSSRVTVWQLVGFLCGLAVLTAGGMLDDKYDLKPWQSLVFPIIAAMIVVATGTTIGHITHPGTAQAWFLDWWTWRPVGFWKLVLPSDALTFVWILVAVYATKISDGLDGLVSGITVIGASMVGALSAMPAYYQPSSVLLASAMVGSFLGFLPRNMHPAKQFLGEGGSTVAGFCLGFLSVVSSAKIAIALAVLAVPLFDVGFVVLRRVLSGHKWYAGDKDTHLHFRLLGAGLPHGKVVWALWLTCAAAGVSALFLQTQGKIFLVLALASLTLLASWWAGNAMKRRNKD